jgi:hypothetical protein
MVHRGELAEPFSKPVGLDGWYPGVIGGPRSHNDLLVLGALFFGQQIDVGRLKGFLSGLLQDFGCFPARNDPTPAMSPSSVDLPAASGPIIPIIWPAGISEVTLSSASVFP